MNSMESTPQATPRVRLARIAEQAIEADDRVGATAGAGRWLTRAEGRTIDGVVAAEAVTGAVDLTLHLVVATPTEPLEHQAALLRQAIVAAAIRENLVGRLGAIDVSFHDVAPAAESEGTP